LYRDNRQGVQVALLAGNAHDAGHNPEAFSVHSVRMTAFAKALFLRIYR
jgi:hypothetical protein